MAEGPRTQAGRQGLRRRGWLVAAVVVAAGAVAALVVGLGREGPERRWLEPTRAYVRVGWRGTCGVATRPDRRAQRGICRTPNGGYYCYTARTTDVRLWDENPIRFDGDCERAKAALTDAGIFPETGGLNSGDR